MISIYIIQMSKSINCEENFNDIENAAVFWVIQKNIWKLGIIVGFSSTYADGRLKSFLSSIRINGQWIATRYVLRRDVEVLAIDATDTLYICHRNWWVLFFWKRILPNRQHHPLKKVSVSVSMYKAMILTRLC